jgi:hypothetical protein
MTSIRIGVADQVLTAELNDTATARDLVGLLPLTLPIRDFKRQEKIAELPRALSMDGVPDGADAQADDIGYYAPSHDLVFYYRDVDCFPGIVRIGRLPHPAVELIERLPDDTEVAIDVA